MPQCNLHVQVEEQGFFWRSLQALVAFVASCTESGMHSCIRDSSLSLFHILNRTHGPKPSPPQKQPFKSTDEIEARIAPELTPEMKVIFDKYKKNLVALKSAPEVCASSSSAPRMLACPSPPRGACMSKQHESDRLGSACYYRHELPAVILASAGGTGVRCRSRHTASESSARGLRVRPTRRHKLLSDHG